MGKTYKDTRKVLDFEEESKKIKEKKEKKERQKSIKRLLDQAEKLPW